MTDTQANTGSTEAPEATQEPSETTQSPTYKAFDELPVRKTFGPDEQSAFNTYLAAVDSLKPDTMKAVVWDGLAEGWPTGYSMAVFQLQERQQIGVTEAGTPKHGRVTQAFVIWPFPTVSAFTADAKGLEYVAGVVESDCMDQISRPFRKQELQSITDKDLKALMADAPFTLTDFATRAKVEGLYKSYNDLAPQALTEIRKMAPKSRFAKRLTAAMLRDCLSDATFAHSVAADWEEKGMFLVILNSLKTAAEAEGKSVQVFDDWIAERDQTEETEEDIDLSGFSLVKGPEAATPAEATTAAAE